MRQPWLQLVESWSVFEVPLLRKLWFRYSALIFSWKGGPSFQYACPLVLMQATVWARQFPSPVMLNEDGNICPEVHSSEQKFQHLLHMRKTGSIHYNTGQSIRVFHFSVKCLREMKQFNWLQQRHMLQFSYFMVVWRGCLCCLGFVVCRLWWLHTSQTWPHLTLTYHRPVVRSIQTWIVVIVFGSWSAFSTYWSSTSLWARSSPKDKNITLHNFSNLNGVFFRDVGIGSLSLVEPQ